MPPSPYSTKSSFSNQVYVFFAEPNHFLSDVTTRELGDIPSDRLPPKDNLVLGHNSSGFCWISLTRRETLRCGQQQEQRIVSLPPMGSCLVSA